MKIIGITGGIGSGKTAVLDIMHQDYGAFIMEADALAHRLMEPGQISYNDIVKHFGRDILDENNRINRTKLSAIVFSDQKQLDILNSITHPNVKKAILESLEEQRRSGCKLYVLEAALLIQDGYLDICDEMWYVYADISKRIERLCAYRGFTEEKAGKVIASQEPDSYYESNCSKKIDNSGDLEKLRNQLKLVMEIEQ